jgi:hypothetical protein
MTDEQDIVERLDMEGLTVTLVDGPHGLAIRQWDNHGLEGGTHHLVAEPIARAEIERLRREVEELKAGNAALEGEVDFRGDALVKASVAINASYAQAHAEWHGHDKVASRHDATVREGREAIREALDLEKMQARHSLAKEARHD